MICREAQRHLSDYIDGYLSPAEALRIEHHLMVCEDCWRMHSDFHLLIAESRALPEIEPSPALWDRLEAEMANAPRMREKASAWWRRMWALDFQFQATFPQLLGGAALLIACAIGLNVVVRQWGTSSSAGSSSLTQDSPGLVMATLSSPAIVISQNKLSSIDSFQQIVDRRKERWSPAVLMLFERSLAAINDSVDECAEAFRRDPGDPVVQEMLEVAYTRKLNLLKNFADF